MSAKFQIRVKMAECVPTEREVILVAANLDTMETIVNTVWHLQMYIIYIVHGRNFVRYIRVLH